MVDALTDQEHKAESQTIERQGTNFRDAGWLAQGLGGLEFPQANADWRELEKGTAATSKGPTGIAMGQVYWASSKRS